jgi:hypothetical protein
MVIISKYISETPELIKIILSIYKRSHTALYPASSCTHSDHNFKYRLIEYYYLQLHIHYDI